MKITRFLKPGQIIPNLEAPDKRSALESLLKVLADSGGIPKDKAGELLQALIDREAQASTGLGYGVALPHVKTALVDRIQIAFGRSDEGIDFNAADGEPAHFFFLLLTPLEAACDHLKMLSLIAAFMKDKKNRRTLQHAETADGLFAILDQTA